MVPYHIDCHQAYVEKLDGLVVPGGLFAFPHEWYIDKNEESPYDASPRMDNDIALLKAFIELDKEIIKWIAAATKGILMWEFLVCIVASR